MKSTSLIRLAGVATISTIGILAPAAHAGAASYPNGGTPQVNPTGTQVLPSQVSRGSTLPFTGGDVAQLAAIGAVSIGAGTFLVRRSRRRVSS
jgi:hypothetical protein